MIDIVNDLYVFVVFMLFLDLMIYCVYDGYWFWGCLMMEELCIDMWEIMCVICIDWKVFIV